MIGDEQTRSKASKETILQYQTHTHCWVFGSHPMWRNPFYVEPKCLLVKNSCGVMILASLGSLGYMCFLPTFHKTYLRKAREKTETKPFKRQPVYHQLAFTKKPFLGVSTVVSSYNFSSLLGTHRASF